MPPSKLDAIYRSLLLTKFFTKGWGKPENLQRLFEFRKIISNREACFNLVPRDYPVEIVKEEVTSDCRIINGKFTTPLELYLPGLVPKIAQDAHFQMVLPLKWNDPIHKPMCIHLAGTGDHYFWRRRNLIAKPLLKEGNLGAIILENPFYGMRKPKDQKASSLHNVSDIFVMGGCLVLESLVLLNWCERNGYGPLGITGLSMGGHMASLAATNWPKPLVLVPCLSWSTASAVFTQGVMSQSINWDVLETQYFADGNYREKLSKMVTVVDDAFLAGQQFVKTYSKSMQELKKDIKEMNELTSSTNPVNLEVIKNTREPQNGVKSTLIDIKAHKNQLNLSENLLNKLLSTERTDLTSEEINELNVKIKSALKKIKAENECDSTKSKSTVLAASDENSKEKMVLQSDTSNNESSTYLSSAINVGRTKLMSLISPSTSSSDTATAISTPSSSSSASSNLPSTITPREKLDITKTKWWEHEATQFMRGMMDECTHLKNFSVPYDTSLIIAVCAKDDAYVPREGCTSLEDIWPGAEVRYLDAGHVSAYVLYQKLFRSSIIEAFERAKLIYASDMKHKRELQERRIIFSDSTSFKDRIKEIQIHKP